MSLHSGVTLRPPPGCVVAFEITEEPPEGTYHVRALESDTIEAFARRVLLNPGRWAWSDDSTLDAKRWTVIFAGGPGYFSPVPTIGCALYRYYLPEGLQADMLVAAYHHLRRHG